MKNIKILFSIPGRIRIRINTLKYNEDKGYIIAKSLSNTDGVLRASFNKLTNNLLISYRENSLSSLDILNKVTEFSKKNLSYPIPREMKDSTGKIILKSLNPIDGFNNTTTKKYKNSFKPIILFGTFFLSFSFTIRRFLSLLLISNSKILDAINSLSNHYLQQKSFYNGVFINDKSDIDKLEITNPIVFEDSILINDNSLIKKEDLDKHDIQKLIYLNKLKDPIKLYSKDLIYSLRENGVNNIYVYSKEDSNLIKYLSSNLEIYRIFNFDDKSVIVSSAKGFDKFYNYSPNIIIYLYKEDNFDYSNGNIFIEECDIKKIPWLYKLIRDIKEYNIRSKNTSIAMNFLISVLLILKRITPLRALILYMLNILGQNIYLENRINKLEESN